MACQTCPQSRIDCVDPWKCALHRVDVSNFADGGETVDLEHIPRGMPITLECAEPAEPDLKADRDRQFWKHTAMYVALSLAILATVLLSAYRG